MADFAIRIATPGDAPRIREIYRHYVENTAVSFEIECPDADAMRERIEKTLESYPWLVAEEDGVICGYAYAGPFKRREAYDRAVEVSVYLDKDERGRGLGRALYEELESILKRQGVLNLNACIARTDRPDDPYLTNGSILFHGRMGYSIVGTFHNCGFKMGRWYSMMWMEKMLGHHPSNPEPFRPFPELALDDGSFLQAAEPDKASARTAAADGALPDTASGEGASPQVGRA